MIRAVAMEGERHRRASAAGASVLKARFRGATGGGPLEAGPGHSSVRARPPLQSAVLPSQGTGHVVKILCPERLFCVPFL